MIIKALEIRDRNTCIPAIAIKMTAANQVQAGYLWRCGYPENSVVLMKLMDQKASSDPHHWGDRTMANAHNYIIDNFNDLQEGQVIDVRVILGETTVVAEAEIYQGG